MIEILKRSVPYILEDVQIEHRPCICGSDDCPAKATQARFYFFSRVSVGGYYSVTWWHGRN